MLDVIFQIAGGTGLGAIEVACAAGIYGIGVDVDQALAFPPDAAQRTVTSAEKKYRGHCRVRRRERRLEQLRSGEKAIYDAASTPRTAASASSPFEGTESTCPSDLQGKLDAATAALAGWDRSLHAMPRSLRDVEQLDR